MFSQVFALCFLSAILFLSEQFVEKSLLGKRKVKVKPGGLKELRSSYQWSVWC